MRTIHSRQLSISTPTHPPGHKNIKKGEKTPDPNQSRDTKFVTNRTRRPSSWLPVRGLRPGKKKGGKEKDLRGGCRSRTRIVINRLRGANLSILAKMVRTEKEGAEKLRRLTRREPLQASSKDTRTETLRTLEHQILPNLCKISDKFDYKCRVHFFMRTFSTLWFYSFS
ncbi:hypothetical protein PoB_001197000 [Plakobranchus ocellatus]|uniref:Uncharacterized protein n=1 Tax=Plakobranchus ocellatus TaxID=259542 RepID=A0AAV3YSQ7_9GAST|nr:hypothetical protein PoB_001197000 [Plakobranchus ocellatus]